MNFLPNTDQDRAKMLKAVGVSDLEELFGDIPKSVRPKKPMSIPGGLSEYEVKKLVSSLSKKNQNLDDLTCYLGAGAYEHHIPSFVDQLLLRQEFYTAYTPYQPEISQGTLQAIFEYQTMICEITGLDAANASLYDGATAMAEAAIMACDRKKEVIISSAIHPEYREVLATYAGDVGIEIKVANHVDGLSPASSYQQHITKQTAAIIVQYPNFFGNIEDLRSLADLAHANKALFIVAVVEPVALGILEAPGMCGADIVVGEGQSFGNSLGFGGPYLGFLAVQEKLVRRMPGRIVGETVDNQGKRAFVLTLQAREQHIRREKASSNICSNQALSALACTMTLAALGKEGLREMAELSLQKAHYAFKKLTALPGVEPVFSAPFFNEFVIKLNKAPEVVNAALLKDKILGGLPLKRFFDDMDKEVLLCVTELRSKAEIDYLAERLGGI
jgi:glycine dehydrogenase subunit 1